MICPYGLRPVDCCTVLVWSAHGQVWLLGAQWCPGGLVCRPQQLWLDAVSVGGLVGLLFALLWGFIGL